MKRRDFIKSMGATTAALTLNATAATEAPGQTAQTTRPAPTRPNVVFVFADQWRAQATGYAGDPNLRTPNLDRLAAESINFTNAISGCPVCSPYRASLITGQPPLVNGVFVNDVCLKPQGPTLAEAFRQAGYATAYLGKWHLDGHGRTSYIPPERRCGFETWKVLECTHDYNRSAYYDGDSPEKRFWPGYDAIAQTAAAQEIIRARDPRKPLLLALSWGGPHNPYQTAPEKYRAMVDPKKIQLRPNVPAGQADAARADPAGYYDHCLALDDCLGDLLKTLEDEKIARDTIFVFTSDHGDMLGSQGQQRKQRPWDESIRVPFLVRYPARFGRASRTVPGFIDAPDIMPTLLGLAGLPIPSSVRGLDFSAHMSGQAPDPSGGAGFIACYHPFGEWTRKGGGREYRGLRTRRHTYVKTLDGPWLLYNNERDPYQVKNLVWQAETREIQQQLDEELTRRLRERGDDFRPGMEYIEKWGYTVDKTGTIPTEKANSPRPARAPVRARNS